MELFHKISIFYILTFVLLNHVWLFARTRKYVRTHYKLKKGFKRFIVRSFVLSLIPWIVIGIGIILGKLYSPLDIFLVYKLNIFSAFFLGYHLIIYALLTYWILLSDGDNFFWKYPGLIIRSSLYGRESKLTRSQLKRIWVTKLLINLLLFSIISLLDSDTIQYAGLALILLLSKWA